MAGNKQPTTKDILIQLKGEVDASFKELLTSVKKLNTGVGDLNKTLSKNTAESLEQVNDKLEETSKDADDAEKKTKVLAKAFEGLGARIKTFVQYRVINAVASSIKDLGAAAIKLESNFANIQAITSATDTEMGKLRNTILRVGEASKYSVEEIASATTMLGQAGLSADEINNVLETTTQLAAGTGSELSNTVDLMTSALAVWGLNSEEASHLSDVMVTGMNRTKATLETFRMAVQYAGATMASLNVSFDEFASVAAAASNAGLRASVVGTGLRAMTSELISPTKKMVKGLAELGLSTEDVNIESQGLVNVLYKLKNAGLTAANAYDLFGKRAAQFVLAAQGQLDVVDELRVAFNESGATLKAYGTQMNTISAQWTALGNTVKGIASDVVDSVSGIVVESLKLFNWFFKNLRIGFSQLKNFLFTGEFKDDFDDFIKQLEDEKTSARSFSKFVDQLKNRDYGDNLTQQLRDLNSVVDEFNKKFGTTVEFVNPLKDIGDEIERIKNDFNEIEDEKIDKLNRIRRYEANKLLSGGLSDEEILRLNQISDKRKFRFSPQVTGFGGGLDFSEMTGREITRQDYQVKIKEYFNELNKRKGDVAAIKNQIQDIKSEGERELAQYAFERAREIYSLYGDIFTSRKSSEFDSEISSFKKEINSTNEVVKTYTEKFEKQVQDLRKAEEEAGQTLINSAQLPKKDIETLVKDIKDITLELSEKNIKGIDSWREELESKGIIDKTEQDEYMVEWKKAKQQTLNMLKSILNKILQTAIDEGALNINPEENKQIQDLVKGAVEDANNVNTSAIDRRLSEMEDKLKQVRADRRSQREIERDKARQFNLKYQGLAIQQQADSYQADIEQARRKGMKSRYDQLDKTGTIGSAYSRYSADKERLEKFKTAYANQETLDKYMKDYGDLFKQVESGKVSLEDADNKSDKLISKMIELQKSTEEARAEFGDLNETNLEDVNKQIAELDEKMKQLDEDSKTTFGQMWIGFQDAVKKMAESYSMANLGATIAQDLGNGMADALNSIVDGSKSAKEAFSDMARSILQDISKMLIRMAVLKAMEAGVRMFGIGGSEPALQGQAMVGAEYANGGFIPKIRAATGAMVRGGIQGKDSVPAMLMPGEYVLKKSAVDALGTNFLNDLNNNAAQTLTNTAANMMQNPYESGSESEPSVVNVWVVSKEEEAQMGPNDVIATISKDIMTGGQTRRLIQSVVAGRK